MDSVYVVLALGIGVVVASFAWFFVRIIAPLIFIVLLAIPATLASLFDRDTFRGRD